MLQEGGLNCVTGLGKYKGRLIVLLDMSQAAWHGAARSRSEATQKPAEQAGGGAAAAQAASGKNAVTASELKSVSRRTETA